MLRREKEVEVVAEDDLDQLPKSKHNRVSRLTSRTPLVLEQNDEWVDEGATERIPPGKPHYNDRCRRCCLMAWILDKFRSKSAPSKLLYYDYVYSTGSTCSTVTVSCFSSSPNIYIGYLAKCVF